MSDVPIPKDIKQAAYKVVERGYNEGLLEAVERAIMAEREACADLAESAESMSAGDGVDDWNAACRSIASAIRRGTA